MELKLHRPHATCAGSGRPFVAGQPFVSALVRTAGRLDRHDFAAETWTGPPDNAVAWWRSTYPSADAAAATLAPVDVLLDVLEELDGRDEDTAFRYVLALELVRRRVLKFSDRGGEAGTGRGAPGDASAELALLCRRRGREYRVRSVPADAAAAPGVEERLVALLWSGGQA